MEINTAPIEFPGAQWASISSEAKDLILKLLQRDPSKRITAAQAMEHEWIKNNLTRRHIDERKANVAIENLRSFNANRKL